MMDSFSDKLHMDVIEYHISKNIKALIKGRVLFKEKSRDHTSIVLQTREFGKVLLMGSNGNELAVQFSEKDEMLYHEAVVQPAMCLHRGPKNILIIGGGDGGAAREALKHDVQKVIIVDIDYSVFDICQGFIPIAEGAFNDKRLNTIIEDGRRYINSTREMFDVIILDLTDPEGPSKMLFTLEFYAETKKRLRPGGVLSVQTSSPLTEPQVLGRVHAALEKVFSTVVAYSNNVPSFFVEESYCIATDRDIEDIAAAVKAAKINLRAFTAEQLSHLVSNPSRQIQEVLKTRWKASSDEDPVTH